jgi:hypothetical protein
MFARPYLVLAAFLTAEGAAACVVVAGAFRPSLWHRLTDWHAPGPPRILTEQVEVRRGKGPRRDGDVTYSTSCDDIGYFALELAPPHDNRTPEEEMGYAFEVVSGTGRADRRGRSFDDGLLNGRAATG